MPDTTVSKIGFQGEIEIIMAVFFLFYFGQKLGHQR